MPQQEQGLVGEVSKRALAVSAELITYVRRGFEVRPLSVLVMGREDPQTDYWNEI
jgi:hypothetical protein